MSDERGRLIGVFERTRQAFSNAEELARAVFSGMWLGILGPKELNALDQRYHTKSRFARADYSRRGLFGWERRSIEQFPTAARVLVVAAGGGREMLALAERGYDVDGCECNPTLVALANHVLAPQGCLVRLAARDSVVARRPPYDVVVVGWGAYALMRGRANRVRFLESLRPIARPQARVLLSFPTRSDRSRGLRLTRALANVLRRLSLRAPIELGDSLGSVAIHHFSRPELESETREAGLEVEVYSESEYGHAVCRVWPDAGLPVPPPPSSRDAVFSPEAR